MINSSGSQPLPSEQANPRKSSQGPAPAAEPSLSPDHDTPSFTHAKRATQAILLKIKKNVLQSYFCPYLHVKGGAGNFLFLKEGGRVRTQKCSLWPEAPLREQPPHSSKPLLPIAGHAELALPTEHTKFQKHLCCSQHFAERCSSDS